MAFDVKITTFLNVLDLVAPFTCRGCGRLGEPLCECCKNYNIRRRAGDLVRFADGVEVAVVALREGVMAKLVEDYKYKSERRTVKVLAEMMAEVVPEFDEDIVVVPLPTIEKHIRERGFDHMKLLGRRLALLKGFDFSPMLRRVNKTVQVGASAEQRWKQARAAYAIAKDVRLDAEKRYLLIDDVWTTGASMSAAVMEMRRAGAKKIAGLVILAAVTKD